MLCGVATDPCPEIPESIVDPTNILKLARALKCGVAAVEDTVVKPVETTSEAKEEADTDTKWKPEPLLHTMVAGRSRSDKFRDVLAQAAWARGFGGGEMEGVRGARCGGQLVDPQEMVD